MDEQFQETGIPCFQCGARSGLNCPGRRPDEATRCEKCFDEYMAEEHEKEFLHLVSFIRSLREKGDLAAERRLWVILKDYDDLCRLSTEVGGRE